jgi:hypothetical protein
MQLALSPFRNFRVGSSVRDKAALFASSASSLMSGEDFCSLVLVRETLSIGIIH